MGNIEKLEDRDLEGHKKVQRQKKRDRKRKTGREGEM